jgi:hypothetical protein
VQVSRGAYAATIIIVSCVHVRKKPECIQHEAKFSEHDRKYIWSSSFLFDDTSTTMYEFEIEEESSFST